VSTKPGEDSARKRARNPKHRAALSVAYGAGLRASEVVSLKLVDVDSQRMTLRVAQGKGRKDRYAMLSPVLLERLRAGWRLAYAEGKILPSGWLFPGLDPTDPMTPRQLNRAVDKRPDAALQPLIRLLVAAVVHVVVLVGDHQRHGRQIGEIARKICKALVH
jgi:integrase